VLYRTEGWDFIVAGGALYNNLDYSFTTKHPDGSLVDFKAPGGGGRSLRKQLKVLNDFIHGFDFIHMSPDDRVIKGGIPPKATALALVESGKQYAVYIKGGTRADLRMALPKGKYSVEWLNPKTGKIDKSETVEHAGGVATLSSPKYTEDIALGLRRVRST
jgi:hypothetical protein